MTTTDANLVPELRWTTAAPTLPGWYWWRECADLSGKIVWVSSYGAVAEVGKPGFAVLRGEWYGPLQVPED